MVDPTLIRKVDSHFLTQANTFKIQSGAWLAAQGGLHFHTLVNMMVVNAFVSCVTRWCLRIRAAKEAMRRLLPRDQRATNAHRF